MALTISSNTPAGKWFYEVLIYSIITQMAECSMRSFVHKGNGVVFVAFGHGVINMHMESYKW